MINPVVFWRYAKLPLILIILAAFICFIGIYLMPRIGYSLGAIIIIAGIIIAIIGKTILAHRGFLWRW